MIPTDTATPAQRAKYEAYVEKRTPRHDPLEVPHDQISKIGVQSTFVGGAEVYTRD